MIKSDFIPEVCDIGFGKIVFYVPCLGSGLIRPHDMRQFGYREIFFRIYYLNRLVLVEDNLFVVRYVDSYPEISEGVETAFIAKPYEEGYYALRWVLLGI